MKKLLFTFLILLQAFIVYGQRDPSKEVLVYFKEGVIQNDTIVNSANVKKFAINKASLKVSLKQIGLTETMFEIANPRFTKSDTVKVLSNGTQLKQLDMTKLVRIKVPATLNRDTLIKRLKALHEVLYAEANGTGKPLLVPNDTY